MLLTKVVALETFINPNFNIKNLRPVQADFWGPPLFTPNFIEKVNFYNSGTTGPN